MLLNQFTLEDCHQITGTAAVIDVRRAFTTAAWAFHQGARKIILSGTVEQALEIRQRFPGALLIGEAGGFPIAQFDLWNSPYQVSQADLEGKTIIQRTSAGTQGIIGSTRAAQILGVSLVVASATVRWIKRLQPKEVGFVVTGRRDGKDGEEDIACAEYMTALLKGGHPDPQSYVEPVYNFPLDTLDAPPHLIEAFRHDLHLCAQIDRFDFAMVVQRQDNLFVMEPVFVNE